MVGRQANERTASLTPRERYVLALVAEGLVWLEGS